MANGYRPQAASGDELRARSYARFAFRYVGAGPKLQASSRLEVRGASLKPQATSLKLKATSHKLPDP